MRPRSASATSVSRVRVMTTVAPRVRSAARSCSAMPSVTSFSSIVGPPPIGPCIPPSRPPCPASMTTTRAPRRAPRVRGAAIGGVGAAGADRGGVVPASRGGAALRRTAAGGARVTSVNVRSSPRSGSYSNPCPSRGSTSVTSCSGTISSPPSRSGAASSGNDSLSACANGAPAVSMTVLFPTRICTRSATPRTDSTRDPSARASCDTRTVRAPGVASNTEIASAAVDDVRTTMRRGCESCGCESCGCEPGETGGAGG